MPKVKVTVTIEKSLIRKLDDLIAGAQFSNRSQAMGEAVAEMLDRLRRDRLARECAKIDPKEERALAEEGLRAELDTWPGY